MFLWCCSYKIKGVNVERNIQVELTFSSVISPRSLLFDKGLIKAKRKLPPCLHVPVRIKILTVARPRAYLNCQIITFFDISMIYTFFLFTNSKLHQPTSKKGKTPQQFDGVTNNNLHYFIICSGIHSGVSLWWVHRSSFVKVFNSLSLLCTNKFIACFAY